jgi:hypothetical protein
MSDHPVDILDAIAMLNAGRILSHEVMHRQGLEMASCSEAKQEAYLQTAIEAWNRALKRIEGISDVCIAVAVGGYESDPRDLWEIPEVCAFMARWARAVQPLDEPRLLPGARQLLLGIGADPDQKVGNQRPMQQ